MGDRPPRASNMGEKSSSFNKAGARLSQRGAPAAGPRLSMTGGVRRSHRHSSRHSRRSNAGGEESTTLQVIDDEGVDRTPKPLMAAKQLGKDAAAPADEGSSPNSEASDFFLDRMSSVGFNRGSFNRGWSEAGSGTMTPKSEGGEDEYDLKAPKPPKGQEPDTDAKAELGRTKREPEAEAEPEVLLEKDMEKQVYITLQETQTTFMFGMACVTVAVDSEEAKVVEAANKRYQELLVTKQAADKYYSVETQTLDLLKKSKEVQSAVLATSSTECQAAKWDIEDTYRAMDDALADAEESAITASGVPSIGQMAGGVHKGGAYGGGDSRRGTSSSHASNVMGHGESTAMGFGGRETGMSGRMSAWGASFSSMAPGAMVPQQAPGSAGGPPNRNSGLLLPEGEPIEGGVAPAGPSPLLSLSGLPEALQLMDAAITQNLYFPKLLAYRDIQQLALQRSGTPDRLREAEMAAAAALASTQPVVSTTSKPVSRALSRVASRTHSEMSMAVQQQQELMSRLASGLGATAPGSEAGPGTGTRPGPASVVGGMGPGYAASMAESAWPEELLQDLADLGPDGVPRMELLWEWNCPLTQGVNVSCMAWNKARPDLLAVGYGTHTFSSEAAEHSVPTQGMVAFWSLKNPGFPLWAFPTRAGVTALDFASLSPNILAVGLYDGTVAIYDVKSKTGSPSMESDATTGRHSDPVWKLRWLDRGQEHEEPLVSISTDGRVTQWSIAKGLEYADLMKLKRVPRKATSAPLTSASANGGMGGTAAGLSSTGGKSAAVAAAVAAAGQADQDAFISRLTSGMTFDFSSRDERIYIAGTEDGWIHKCSTSYSEQYLESYQGHMGPVYGVQWSPFRKDMFISASGDWTIRMWQEGRDSALLTFQSGSHEVNDVQWCPTNSTVFGSVTSSGRLEIWDFDLSTVKPVVNHKAGYRLSCLLFSPNSPVVVCGGASGSVSVFRLHNIDKEYDTMEEQLSRLDDTIRANVMKQAAGKGVV